MAQFIKLDTSKLTQLRTIDPSLMSYNVEMTEVTGGTFWKAYTPGQIAGTEELPPIKDFSEAAKLLEWKNPIDLYNPRLRKLAKELGAAWIRVSGGWANSTYYDFDGHTGGKAPAGYGSVLTRAQWIGVLDFVKAVDGKLLVSMANCEGLHSAQEPWNPSQAELLFGLSKEYGVSVNAVEFVNEPNVMMESSGSPKGYNAAYYRRDQDLFIAWVRTNYPDCLLIGPCTTDSRVVKMGPDDSKGGAGIGDMLNSCSTEELMDGCKEKFDAFSYHYYNGISDRLAPMMPSAHWPAADAASDPYLAIAGRCARGFAPFRDKYCPGGQMWVTESGDAGGGGDTWASTYLDVLRTLNELGDFATVTDGVIFHNTLASSDYGFLQHGTFEPRPNYFAVLLWNTLMGTTVYDSGEEIREGAHVYCHSRKDGKDGCVYLIINNSLTDTTTVELPKAAVHYTLAGRDGMRSTVMTLNGRDLTLGENDELPCLCGETVSGTIELAPGSCTFLVL